MKILLRITLTALTFISLFNSSLLAQNESPITPEQIEPNFLGGLVGIGRNDQLGEMVPDCDTCNFTGGVKFGYTVGASYEMTLNDVFNIGALGLFSDYGFKAIYDDWEPVEGISAIDGSKIRHTLKLRHTGDFSLKVLSLVPYVKIKPAEWLFMRAGVSVGFPLSHKLEHRIELIDKSETLPGDYNVHYELLNDSLRSGVHELNSPIVELFPQIGLVIPLTSEWSLSPQLHYAIPLTNISDSGLDFKISTLRIMLELRYIVNSKSKIYMKK
ncbi:MAG: hypothetical protein ACM3U1_05900 [Chloroflexota bacterium]